MDGGWARCHESIPLLPYHFQVGDNEGDILDAKWDRPLWRDGGHPPNIHLFRNR